MKIKKILLLLSISAMANQFNMDKVYSDDVKGSYKVDNSSKLTDTHSSVARASEVYKSVINGEQGKVPSSVLKNAKCIAVFPNVKTAALAVGGTHGDGVAFCRDVSGNWSNPVFLNLNGGSLGIQAGYKSGDLVLYMTTEKARDAIQNGNFALSGELSAVGGTYDETIAPPKSGVYAYSRTKGLFAGASFSGMNISVDKDEELAFYGKDITELRGDAIFNRELPASVQKSVIQLKTMLPS